MQRPLTFLGSCHNAFVDFTLQSALTGCNPALARCLRERDEDTFAEYMESLIKEIWPPYNPRFPFPAERFSRGGFGGGLEPYFSATTADEALLKTAIRAGLAGIGSETIGCDVAGAEILQEALDKTDKSNGLSDERYLRFRDRLHKKLDFQDFEIAHAGLETLHASSRYFTQELGQRPWMTAFYGADQAAEVSRRAARARPWRDDLIGAAAGAAVCFPLSFFGGLLAGVVGTTAGALFDGLFPAEPDRGGDYA